MPIFYNDEEMAELKGSFTIQKIQSKNQSLHTEYQNIIEILEDEEFNINYNEFVWGRCAVITRIFGLVINDIKTDGLVPWVDLIDHAPPAPNRVKWTYDGRKNQFKVQARTKMNIGDELFVTYGRKWYVYFYLHSSYNSRSFVNMVYFSYRYIFQP